MGVTNGVVTRRRIGPHGRRAMAGGADRSRAHRLTPTARRNVGISDGVVSAASDDLPYPFVSVATTERDFYVILGVERTASDAQIKSAFRKLAQKWHPDVNTDPAAQERFKEINEAYQVLSDPERRSRYDTFGRAGVDGGARRRRPGSKGSAVSRTSSTPSSVAGRARPSARRGRPLPGRRPALRPADHLRGGRQRHREGDRVHRPAALRDVRRQRRQARHRADHLPAVQRPRRGPLDPPDDARPDGQRQRLPALRRRGQDHRDAVRHVSRATAARNASARSASRSRPGSTRATRSASRTRARSGREAVRPAACMSRSTSSRIRR